MKVIIVGGGLAGLSLAHQLEKNNISFRIIDKGINYSSKIAAGMINPMTFRRMIKTWKGDELIPALLDFYPEIEKKLQQRFFFKRKLRRAFASQHEHELWMERLADEEYKSYINPPEKKADTPKHLNAPFGNGFINTPGYIDTQIFMESNHKYFLAQEKLEYATFDFEALAYQSKKYKGETYTHLIFCEGFQGQDNPFFDYLPFKNSKGEVLTVQSEEFSKNEILNKKCFILPTEDGDFKLGSTYSWNTKDASPSREGKVELLEKYRQLSSIDFKITAHEGGIRPTSADRRPFIGEHPTHKGLFIFNGLGAKGYMIAPYFAIEFVDYLRGKSKLDKEVDIQRCYKKYFKI